MWTANIPNEKMWVCECGHKSTSADEAFEHSGTHQYFTDENWEA